MPFVKSWDESANEQNPGLKHSRRLSVQDHRGGTPLSDTTPKNTVCHQFLFVCFFICFALFLFSFLCFVVVVWSWGDCLIVCFCLFVVWGKGLLVGWFFKSKLKGEEEEETEEKTTAGLCHK